MRITPPKAGVIRLGIHIDECTATEFLLRAEHDDLMKLKEWMEQVVREERAEVELSGGQQLAYRVTDVPESEVAPTIRFLDELFPSPIGILTLIPTESEAVECVVKVKHVLNALYLHLLTGGNPDGAVSHFCVRFAAEWYAHAPLDPLCRENVREDLFHYNQIQSSLLEWYLTSSVPYEKAQPQFRWLRTIPEVLTMWDDWGELFWHEGAGAGCAEGLGVGDYDFDLSDIVGLHEWNAEFMERQKMQSVGETDGEDCTLTQKDRAWHIRGYRLAQQVKLRMPLNAALIYELTWDVAFDTPEWKKDVGHVIFDPRLLEHT